MQELCIRSMKKRFLLRLDPDVYEALEKWAADDLRSVNGHIEFLLLNALRQKGRMVRHHTTIEASNGAAEVLLEEKSDEP